METNKKSIESPRSIFELFSDQPLKLFSNRKKSFFRNSNLSELFYSADVRSFVFQEAPALKSSPSRCGAPPTTFLVRTLASTGSFSFPVVRLSRLNLCPLLANDSFGST